MQFLISYQNRPICLLVPSVQRFGVDNIFNVLKKKNLMLNAAFI